MHHDFKGKFYTPVFSIAIGLPYKVNGFAKTSTQKSLLSLTFIFQRQLDHLLWQRNSSHCQKSAILAFTFTVNTFLSLTENGSNLTDSNVFVMLNVGGLHNPD